VWGERSCARERKGGTWKQAIAGINSPSILLMLIGHLSYEDWEVGVVKQRKITNGESGGEGRCVVARALKKATTCGCNPGD